jgi:hypothetical protein
MKLLCSFACGASRTVAACAGPTCFLHEGTPVGAAWHHRY